MQTNLTFATLREGEAYRLGIKTERGILDVRKAVTALGVRAPETLDALLQDEGGIDALQRLLQQAPSAKSAASLFIDETDAEFGPCVPHPEKIVCIGLNYRKHAAETRNPVPTVPVVFSKFNNALSGHRGTVRISEIPAERFDYEAELVIVIGRTARNVSEADALSRVFGYCVGNDLSVRDLQMRTSQWLLGKTGDGLAPIGPYLVGAGAVPDPGNLAIECRVNGGLRQSSNTADMVFGCASLIAYLSRYLTLRPGDIIFTGTPEGVILGYPKEKRVWLKPGDRVSTTIERLGTQEVVLA